jgi:hypothetical protein
MKIEKYHKLIAVLLNMASDEFGNHSCNDFDLSIHIPNVNERRELVRAMYEDNGDSENFDPEDDCIWIHDFWLMGYFAGQFDQI